MPAYRVTEPHPSVPTTNILYSGRGGAGNITRVQPSNITHGATASGPASRIALTTPPTSSYFSTGRGGAGNVYREKERAIFSFDEELAQQERLRDHAAPVYHIGRGGAGNAVDEMHLRPHRQNSASSTMSSESEKENAAAPVRQSSTWSRVSEKFTRRGS